MKLTITGAPRTKKNSREHFNVPGRGLVPMPSKAWRAWVQSARLLDGNGLDINPYRPLIPDIALNCRATFYRDARRGDAVGFYQGLADLLEKRRVISNDAQLVSWDGTRLAIDRDNPRTEISLEQA